MPETLIAPPRKKYLVSEWFARNTFQSRDFANCRVLLKLKEKQGVRISLGLPTLNEEKTIGTIISVIHAELVKKYPLLDEIVVIDSGSTDRTVEIAREKGIPVYQHAQILPEEGSYTGKGEALWKSLAVLQGDIIVWIDTDIKNIHPRFVYGLVGPLLRRPDLVYVKGYYLRPIKMGDVRHPVGGGRVTEILARPLLNLFSPELSGFLQPLSGEYAGRRSALERVPFSVGYGVEIGLLLDLLQAYGPEALAQVDLQRRIHRNQGIDALGRMSFGILQTFLKKLSDAERLRLQTELNLSLNTPSRFGRVAALSDMEIQEHFRPPIAGIPAYRQLRGLEPSPMETGGETPAKERPVSVRARRGEVDIVVGIPSFNNARTIGHVVRAVSTGLAKYYRGQRAVVVNSDGGSTDGTPEVVQAVQLEGLDLETLQISHPLYPVHKIVTPYHGMPGKGSALRAIFQVATDLNVKACAVVDADLRSITPEWVDLLVGPVLRNRFDFVAPYYLRHKYDGTITNSIVYPLTRTLYGKNIRQPIGGDFGFSGELAKRYLSKDVWETNVAQFGVDIWMTTTAVAEGFRVCQAFLGAKIHDHKDPGVDLSNMMMQVVGVVFDLMEAYHTVWSQVREVASVPLFGFQYEVGSEPIHVNVDRMITHFQESIQTLEAVYRDILSPEAFERLASTLSMPKESFSFPEDLWVLCIFDYAVACHRKVMNRQHLLKSMTPLYLGRTASFVQETWTSSSRQVEEKLAGLCEAFIARKPYLIKRWEGD